MTHREFIKQDIATIQSLNLNPVQVYILCKASENELFMQKFNQFKKYLLFFGKVKCSEDNKIEMIENLLLLNFGHLDDLIMKLVQNGELDQSASLVVSKKKFLASSSENTTRTEKENSAGYSGDKSRIQATHGSELIEVRANGTQELSHQYEPSPGIGPIPIHSVSNPQETDQSMSDGPDNISLTLKSTYPILDMPSYTTHSDEMILEDQQPPYRNSSSSAPIFEQKLAPNIRELTCIYCGSPIIDYKDTANFSKCNHNMHITCLIDLVDKNINSRVIDMNCRCNEVIEENDLIKSLPKQNYDKLDEMRIRLLLESEGIISMECRGCRDVLSINKSFSFNTCRCGINYCTECQKEYNIGHKCNYRSSAAIPSCDHMKTIKRSAGIGLVSCDRCKAILCKICTEEFRTCKCPKRKY